MAKNWLDNAFWETPKKQILNAISEDEVGNKQVRQVHRLDKVNEDGTDNELFIEAVAFLGQDKIDESSKKRLEKKQGEAELEKQKKLEHERAEAKICLVTEEHFLDDRADEADKIILCDDHYRAKLWGMAQSPWDITMYVDADMDCEHEDIAKVWDEMKDYDMVFHALTPEREKYCTTNNKEICGDQKVLTRNSLTVT